MQRIDGPTRAAVLPPPTATGIGVASPGYFSDGDPLSGIPATTVPADWFNAIQEEMAGVIEHAGIPLNKADRGQLMAALLATFVPKGAATGIVIGANQISVPLGGGIILKAGSVTGSFAEQTVNVGFDTAFPNGCFIAIPVAINASGSLNRDIWAQRQSKSAAGFVAVLQYPGGSANTASSDGIDWIALGN